MKNNNNKSGIGIANPKTNRSHKAIINNKQLVNFSNVKKENNENPRQYMSYFDKLKNMINNNSKYKKLNEEFSSKLNTMQQKNIRSNSRPLYEQRQSLIPSNKLKSEMNRNQEQSEFKSIEKTITMEIENPVVSMKHLIVKPYKQETVNYKKAFDKIVQTENIVELLELNEILGTGANAAVRRGFNKLTNENYAVKIYEKYKLIEPRKLRNVYKEIKIMKALNHSNVIALHGAYQDKRQIHIVMEYFEGETLLQYFRSQNFNIPIASVKSIAKSLIEAVAYMHETDISHRDVKLENILVNPQNLQIKMIDFGFAVSKNKKCQVHCGTPNYMAPELFLKNNTYDPCKVDVWAIGVVVYYLLEGVFPFKGYDQKDLVRKIKNTQYSVKKGGKQFQEFVSKIFEVDADLRISSENLLYQDWLL